MDQIYSRKYYVLLHTRSLKGFPHIIDCIPWFYLIKFEFACLYRIQPEVNEEALVQYDRSQQQNCFDATLMEWGRGSCCILICFPLHQLRHAIVSGQTGEMSRHMHTWAPVARKHCWRAALVFLLYLSFI